MSYTKPLLTDEEKQIHAELLDLAEGMGRQKTLEVLSADQKRVIQELGRKGYVALTKKNFMVVLPVS